MQFQRKGNAGHLNVDGRTFIKAEAHARNTGMCNDLINALLAITMSVVLCSSHAFRVCVRLVTLSLYV